MISAFGVEHNETFAKREAPRPAKKQQLSDRNRKEVAGASAAGAGAGALAAPGRRINPGGRRVDPAVRNLPEGVHQVDPKKLVRHAQGTGFRIGDRAHVARTAQRIKREGYDPKRPVAVTVWNDRAMVNSGNHRVFGTAISGEKSIPVKIRRAHGNAPADQWRGGQIYDAVRGSYQRAYYKKAQKKGESWVDRNAPKAVKPGSWQDRFNTKLSGSGELKARRAAKVLSTRSYYGRNAAMIGGGAAAAGGSKYLYEKGKLKGKSGRRPVAKSYDLAALRAASADAASSQQAQRDLLMISTGSMLGTGIHLAGRGTS